MGKINVLGMGPGHRDYVLPIAIGVIKESDILIGGKRILCDYKDTGKEIFYIDCKLDKIIKYIKENMNDKKISLLLSGDTGFYSMLEYLKKHFTSDDLNVIPGISSYQYLMAKLKKSWQDAFIGSVHGRDLDILEKVKTYSKVILLTDSKNSPRKIAMILENANIKNKRMIVGENLSYKNERIIKGLPIEISKLVDIGMSVVVIEDDE